MDVEKRPVIRALNALMVCLGVVAGGLMICSLLLAYTVSSGQPDGSSSSDFSSGSQLPLENDSTSSGAEDDEQILLEGYEEAITSGTATAETYLNLADIWMSREEEERAEEVLRQGLESLGNNADLEELLTELTGEPVTETVSAKLLWRDTYDEAGNLAWSHVYQYDEQGRLSGVTSYNSAGTQTGFVEVLYDSNGNQIQAYSWMGGTDEASGTVDPIVFRYDAAGKLEREELYFGGELECYIVDQYDEREQVIRSDTYNPDGTLMSYALYTYDGSGMRTRYDSFTPSGELESFAKWTYDAMGEIVEYVSYGADGTEYIRTIYSYDSAGNVIQEETREGETTTVARFQYG